MATSNTLSGTIKTALTEAPGIFMPSQHSRFSVDYYVVTSRGTSARFQRTSTLAQIRGAESETAVRSYLQKLHPGCEIQIQQLHFS